MARFRLRFAASASISLDPMKPISTYWPFHPSHAPRLDTRARTHDVELEPHPQCHQYTNFYFTPKAFSLTIILPFGSGIPSGDHHRLCTGLRVCFYGTTLSAVLGCSGYISDFSSAFLFSSPTSVHSSFHIQSTSHSLSAPTRSSIQPTIHQNEDLRRRHPIPRGHNLCPSYLFSQRPSRWCR